MYKEVLKHFPMIDLVVAGELIFFTVFVCSLIWIFRRGSKDFYDRLSKIPFEKEGISHEK